MIIISKINYYHFFRLNSVFERVDAHKCNAIIKAEGACDAILFSIIRRKPN